MKKLMLSMVLVAAPFVAGANTMETVTCNSTSIVIDFSGNTSISGASISQVTVGTAQTSGHNALTSGSTFTQTDNDTITINLSSADQSTNSSALSGSCYVSISAAAFSGVTATVLPE